MRKQNIVVLDDHSYEIHVLLRYSPYSGLVNCVWAAEVETNSDIIKSWRYVSDPSLCVIAYFYEGAW